MFRKVLVANRARSPSARSAPPTSSASRTVAVFPYEDRNSLHRAKADESYQIGEVGHPVRAYLSVDEVMKAARRAGADAVYPGYGFLSENPDLAQACADAGITFVGPPADVLHLTGNKARAIAAAREAGVRGAALQRAVRRRRRAGRGGRRHRVPDLRQGGRGRWRAWHAPGASGPRTCATPIDAAMREAESAFGDATVFLEQAVVNPRHIEVQILADAEGNVVHLYERDCSMQRRHQKVIEIAPAPNLDPELRDRICADAVAFAKAIGYVNAGTVEFLLDERGNHVFIEMNPRIQVEHTVTEQVTDRDLVIAQLRIAAGATLPELNLSQDQVTLSRRRAAVPGHHRGPGQRVPPRHRRDQQLPLAGRPGRAARRRHDPHRGRGQRALRLDAGQARPATATASSRRCGGRAARSRSSASAASRRTCRSWPPSSTTRTSRRAASPRASSTSAPACCASASPPTAAPAS